MTPPRSRVLCWTLLALASGAHLLAFQQVSPTPVQFERQKVLDELDLRDFELQSFLLPEIGGPPVRTRVYLDGGEYEIDVTLTLVTSPDVEFWDVTDTGYVRDLDPPRCVTYQGDVLDPLTGSVVGHVRATVDEFMLWAVLWLDDGRSFGIQPVADALRGFDPSSHVVYSTRDMITAGEMGFVCGNDFLPDLVGMQAAREEPRDPAGARDATDDVIDVAIDNTYEWRQFWQSKKQTVRESQKVINIVNGMYEVSGIDKTFRISYFLNHLNGPGPYPMTDSNQLLDALIDTWESGNPALARRDTVHLFVGADIDSSIIGLAQYRSLCSSFFGQLSGYGISQVTFTNGLINRAGLVAHELGHNCGASHCDGTPQCGVMCSSFGRCSGVVDVFGPQSAQDIPAYVNNRPCIQPDVNPIVPPFFDNFESGVNTSIWNYNNGASTSTGATNEPSGSLSLRLDGTGPTRFEKDEYWTDQILNSGTTSGSFDFWYEVTNGAGAGDVLAVRLRTGGNHRALLGKISHNGVNQTSFTPISMPLPYPEAGHDLLEIGFLFIESNGVGRVYVDDVSFTSSVALLAFLPTPGPQGSHRLMLQDATPGQRAHFFVNLAGKAMSAENRQIHSLGSAVADPMGRAVLELPSSEGLGDLEVEFFAVLEMPNGGLKLQPIRVRIP